MFQDLTWNYFKSTGNIEAYLAYKETNLTTSVQEVHLVSKEDIGYIQE